MPYLDIQSVSVRIAYVTTFFVFFFLIGYILGQKYTSSTPTMTSVKYNVITWTVALAIVANIVVAYFYPSLKKGGVLSFYFGTEFLISAPWVTFFGAVVAADRIKANKKLLSSTTTNVSLAVSGAALVGILGACIYPTQRVA